MCGPPSATTSPPARRLSRYGDRISVRPNADLRRYLAIDSSVFHLVLDEI